MRKRDLYGANHRIKKMISMSILLDDIHKNISRTRRYSLNAVLYKSFWTNYLGYFICIFYVKFLEVMGTSKNCAANKNMVWGEKIWNLQRKMNPIYSKIHYITGFLMMHGNYEKIYKILNWNHYGTFQVHLVSKLQSMRGKHSNKGPHMPYV